MRRGGEQRPWWQSLGEERRGRQQSSDGGRWAVGAEQLRAWGDADGNGKRLSPGPRGHQDRRPIERLRLVGVGEKPHAGVPASGACPLFCCKADLLPIMGRAQV